MRAPPGGPNHLPKTPPLNITWGIRISRFEFLKIFVYLFTYWLHQVLVAARGIFPSASRALCCGARASL